MAKAYSDVLVDSVIAESNFCYLLLSSIIQGNIQVKLSCLLGLVFNPAAVS